MLKFFGRGSALEVSAVAQKEQLACVARRNSGQDSTRTTVILCTRLQKSLTLEGCRRWTILIQKENGERGEKGIWCCCTFKVHC